MPINETRMADKTSSAFNLETETQKIKIPIPLVELMKNEAFKKSIMSALDAADVTESSDILNVQDGQPKILLGPMAEGRDENCPPFYISLNIHDKTLHNCLLDSGASHNLMPKAIMEELGLQVTKTYRDLFSFDSNRVKCHGLIKDLDVTLAHSPMKTTLMDIVVADIPPKFGCLLSRSWMKRLGSSLQMDLSYATIPVFGGGNKRLYRESQISYIISDDQNPENHPIHSIDTGMGSCILQVDDSFSNDYLIKQPAGQQTKMGTNDQWTLFFDGACTKELAGVGVVIISPSKQTTHLAYKLNFKVTNNIAEYEALLLGLKAAKDMGIKNL